MNSQFLKKLFINNNTKQVQKFIYKNSLYKQLWVIFGEYLVTLANMDDLEFLTILPLSPKS